MAKRTPPTSAMTIEHVAVADVYIPEGRRPVDPEMVKRIAESMVEMGLLHPITVCAEGAGVRLVAGAHRLQAAISLGWESISATFVDGDDVRLRLAEIAENLHRSELTALERDKLVAEWIRLTAEKVSQSGTPSGGLQPKAKGIRAAERELGVKRSDASRAFKVASLSPEAEQAARETGLDNNRSALLEAAKAREPEKQVATLRATKTQKHGRKRRPERKRGAAVEVKPQQDGAEVANDKATAPIAPETDAGIPIELIRDPEMRAKAAIEVAVKAIGPEAVIKVTLEAVPFEPARYELADRILRGLEERSQPSSAMLPAQIPSNS